MSQAPTPRAVWGIYRAVQTCPQPQFWSPADASTDSRCDPIAYEWRLGRARIPVCGACRGTVPDHRRNHIGVAAHGSGGGTVLARMPGWGERRKYVRRGKVRLRRESNHTHHTEIRPELRDRRAERHSKRVTPAGPRC